MILDQKKLLSDLSRDNLLTIQVNSHERTWDFYHKQYHNAFHILLEKSKEKCYTTNSRFRPFLFLLRHSLELYLKGKIVNLAGKDLLKSHNLSNLCVHVPACSNDFKKSFSCLQCDSEGDCFRYLVDKSGHPYFSSITCIDAFEACYCYCKCLYGDTSLDKLRSDRGFRWELKFHPAESSGLGLIATQYDSSIIDILYAIRDRKITVNEVYLPLLFLLRHSLEIKLKMDIAELKGKITDTDYQRSQETHSVKELYGILEGLIDIAIKPLSDPMFKGVCENACSATESYKDLVDRLDRNSLSFRFPKDRTGNNSNFIPTPDCVSELLQLYWDSDSFLCFGILYLHGYE